MNSGYILERINRTRFVVLLDEEFFESITKSMPAKIIKEKVNEYLYEHMGTKNIRWDDMWGNNEVIECIRERHSTVIIEIKYTFKNINEFNKYKLTNPYKYQNMLEQINLKW